MEMTTGETSRLHLWPSSGRRWQRGRQPLLLSSPPVDLQTLRLFRNDRKSSRHKLPATLPMILGGFTSSEHSKFSQPRLISGERRLIDRPLRPPPDIRLHDTIAVSFWIAFRYSAITMPNPSVPKFIVIDLGWFTKQRLPPYTLLKGEGFPLQWPL